MIQEAVPTLCFNGQDFSNFISFVKSMNVKEKSKYAKIALLHVENGRLVCRAIDDPTTAIEYCIDLFYSEKIITEPIAVSITDFATLVKCPSANDKFTIRKQLGQYEFNIVGDGWLPFKTVDVEVDKFIINDNCTEIGTVNSVKFRNAISCVIGYTQDGTYARDKYLRFTDDKMVVTSRRSSITITDRFANVTIHRDEAIMLKGLIKDNFNLSISSIDVGGVEHTVFSGPKFKMSVVSADVPNDQVDYVEDINDYVTVDCDELFKLVTCAEEYAMASHVVGLLIKDGVLKVHIKNHLAANNVSTVRSNSVGQVKNTTNEADVNASHLLKTLKLFQDKKSKDINVYITDELLSKRNSIVIFDGNAQAIVNIYSK